MLTHVDRIRAKASRSEANECVSWAESGLAFVIRNRDEFVKGLLPLFFREAKFASFTRKLYRWGFRQICIPQGGDRKTREMIFGHEYFRREDKSLMSNMRSVTAAGTRRAIAALTSKKNKEKKSILTRDDCHELDVVGASAKVLQPSPRIIELDGNDRTARKTFGLCQQEGNKCTNEQTYEGTADDAAKSLVAARVVNSEANQQQTSKHDFLRKLPFRLCPLGRTNYKDDMITFRPSDKPRARDSFYSVEETNTMRLPPGAVTREKLGPERRDSVVQDIASSFRSNDLMYSAAASIARTGSYYQENNFCLVKGIAEARSSSAFSGELCATAQFSSPEINHLLQKEQRIASVSRGLPYGFLRGNEQDRAGLKDSDYLFMSQPNRLQQSLPTIADRILPSGFEQYLARGPDVAAQDYNNRAQEAVELLLRFASRSQPS